MPKDSAELPPYFALAIVLFGSAVAFAIVMGQTYRKLFRAPEWATWTTAAATLLGISVVIRYGGYGHIYDFSVLALTAAMLSALFFERLTLYLILFVVACWTKETTIFMAIAYFAIYWDRLPRRRLFLHLAIQGLAFVAAYATLRLLFRNNEGVPIEDWASKQLAWFLAKPVRRTVMLAAGAAAIFFAWGEKPVSLRRALMPVAPHVALFVIGAQPAELRSLYESAPVVMLFVFRNIALLCGRLGHAGRSLVPQQQ